MIHETEIIINEIKKHLENYKILYLLKGNLKGNLKYNFIVSCSKDTHNMPGICQPIKKICNTFFNYLCCINAILI